MDTVPPSDVDFQVDRYEDLLRDGEVYAEQGFYLKAIELYQFVMDRDEPRAEVLLKIAECYLKMDDNEEALEWLHKAYKLDNLHIEVAYLLGFVYFLEAEYERAISYFDKALDIGWKRDAMYYKALALMREKETDESLKVFDSILDRDPLDHFALYQKGLIYLRRNEKDLATQILKKAKELGNEEAGTLIGE